MAAPLINTDLSYWRSRRRIGNSDYDDQIKQGLQYFQDHQQEIQALVDQYGWNKASDMLYEQAGPADRNQMSMMVVYDAIEDAYSPNKINQRMALGQTPRGEILQDTNTGVITPSSPAPISLTPTAPATPQNRSYNDGASGVSIASVPGSNPTRVSSPPTTSSMPSTANQTLYFQNRDGSVSTNVVPPGDVSYWLSQGWSAGAPSGSQSQAATQPAPQPQAPTASAPRSDVGTPASMTVPSDGTKTNLPYVASGQPIRIGESQLSQLRGQGLIEDDIVRQGINILVRPTSKFYTQVLSASGTSPTGATTPTASPPSNPILGPNDQAQGFPTSVETPIDPANKAWIDSYYKKYFDRTASAPELANWSKETPEKLDQFLKKEAKIYNYTSTYFKDEGNQRLEAAKSIINNSNLPPKIKDLWLETVAGYPSGMEYNAQEVLNTFNQIKTNTIDPQFAELATIASRDFQRNIDAQKSKFEMDQEVLRTTAGNSIRQAKEGLEKSGMTFSGKAIEDLGANAAIPQPGITPNSAVPQQEPFGGLFYEGKVNQQNRLMASSASLANKNTMDALNTSLETQLGSSAAAGRGAQVQGGITGSLETDKQGVYGQTLSQIMDTYKKKQTLNTNITT